MVNNANRSDLNAIQALKWLISMGADEIILDHPIDRTARFVDDNLIKDEEIPEQMVQLKKKIDDRPAPVGINQIAPAEGAHDAAACASEATNIKELKEAVDRFDGCALKFTATNTVFSDGSPSAKLMIIGEAPGVDEDIQGRPFVGSSGLLLNSMLRSISIERPTDCYITNILFWRPPGNRSPTNSEIAACLPFVWRHIELINPKIILLLGGTAAKTILGSKEGIMKLRGHWANIMLKEEKRPIPCMPTFHPAYLLRQPARKKETWQDLRAIKTKLLEH